VEQVRYSWEDLHRDTGITTEDIALRMADYGMHLWSSHHPFIVPQPFTVEPTESYSRQELDEYVATLEAVAGEAYEDPATVASGPHRSVCHRADPAPLDDPRRWAITWRLLQRKGR
jgi:glycine dehydrogenase subunit 2